MQPNYLILFSTVYDTPVFRLSLQSLLETAPKHATVVVVEDGLYEESKCKDFCDVLKVPYLKYPNHNSMGQMFNWATETISLESFTHVVLSHNDLYFPDDWSQTLDEAISRLASVAQSQRAPVINLSHQEYSFRDWNVPSHISYEELQQRLVPYLFYTATLDSFFGVSQDRWNMSRVGRLSPFICMTKDFYSEIKFQDTGHGYDCEILWLLYQSARWSIWINNARLLHFRPTESGNDTVLNHKFGQGADHYDWMDKNVKKCEELFGTNLERWLDVEFGLIKQIHKEEIEDVFNNRLAELGTLDYIFQEIREALT